MEHNVVYIGNDRCRLYVGSSRRCVVTENANPYDELGYIKDGKTFHLDGISTGNIADAWTDLVGGVSFPIVSGVTYVNDHFNFASGHDVMKSSNYTELNFPLTGTIEAVCKFQHADGVGIIYSYKAGGMSIIYYGKNLYSAIQGSESQPYYAARNYTGTVLQVSLSGNAGYFNNVLQTAAGSGSMRRMGSYCVIGNGHTSTNYPLIGDIYSIRYYNRVLTADEVAHNYTIDQQRFGLT